MLNPQVLQMLWPALWETLYMVAGAAFFGNLIGIPLGILVVVTSPDHILPNRVIHRIAGIIINIGRSIPFIILMVAIIPFTRWLVGTSIGTKAAVVPLAVAAIPYIARLVETALHEALREVDGDVLLVPDPQTMYDLVSQVGNLLAEKGSSSTAIVCSQALRRPLRHSLRSAGLDIPVVAYPEIPASVTVDAKGVIANATVTS